MVSSLDVHRLFLQSAISRRVLSAELAKVIWKQCVEAVKAADNTLQINASIANDWGAFLTSLNKSLDPLDLELSRIRNEVTGKEMYALVNRRDDEIARIASDYTPLEISYFRALVEQIMLAQNSSYSISSLAALREVNALTSPMSKTQAETVLASFVTKGLATEEQKGSVFPVPTRLTRVATIPQVNLPRRDPRLYDLLRDPYAWPRVSQGQLQSTHARCVLRDLSPFQQ